MKKICPFGANQFLVKDYGRAFVLDVFEDGTGSRVACALAVMLVISPTKSAMLLVASPEWHPMVLSLKLIPIDFCFCPLWS